MQLLAALVPPDKAAAVSSPAALLPAPKNIGKRATAKGKSMFVKVAIATGLLLAMGTAAYALYPFC
jgi:hypothetical protein